MNPKSIKFSRYLCYLLRHNPSQLDLDMNDQGFVSINQLINNLSSKDKITITLDDLNDIVATDDKMRYNITDGNIRCNQGHSLDFVNITFDQYKPTHDLYHGTSPKYIESILEHGLKPQSRNYVHLSTDVTTAKSVGKRHSKDEEPVILVIEKDVPVEFWITDNDVVQAKFIDPEFIHVLSSEDEVKHRLSEYFVNLYSR